MQAKIDQIVNLSEPPFQVAEISERTNKPFLYDVNREYSRIMKTEGEPGADCGWRLHDQTDGYTVCSTYPRVLGVPATATDELVGNVARFRSKGRIPVLCWLHPHSDAPKGVPQRRAALLRCAQPHVGLCGKKSAADEEYFRMIVEQSFGTVTDKRVLVLDARDKAAAQVSI